MDSRMIVVAALAMVLAAGGATAADEKAAAAPAAPEIKRQTMCPVMGGKINKSIYVDHDGKRVYFCCGACPAEFKKDPAKYITKMEKDGITLDKVQVNCPITGEKMDKAFFADYDGKRVYFCDATCMEKFKADPKAVVTKMEAEGIALEKAPAKTEKK